MIVPIIISVIALIISVISYYKHPKWEYTEKGIVFYDKTGKKIVIEGE